MRNDINLRKEEIEAWLLSGVSQRECAKRLNCKIETLKSRLQFWGLDHLKNQSGKGQRKIDNRQKPIEYYLQLDGPCVKSHLLKVKLWDVGLKPMHCEICNWAEWSGDNRLPLELDHINGNHYDNRLLNLRILCPNCHALQLGNSGSNVQDKVLSEDWMRRKVIRLWNEKKVQARVVESQTRGP